MAKLTASASGTNRNLATPDRKNMGMKTIQMQSVETKAGTAICCAPSRIAWTVSLPIARLRLMFSISTVASSARMATASAERNRQRERDGNDQGAFPVSEEEQNHDGGEASSDKRFADDTLDGSAD